MVAFMGLGGQELIFIFLFILLLFLALPVIALIDIIRSDFKGQNDKLIWVVIILFLNVVGDALYFFLGRNQRVA